MGTLSHASTRSNSAQDNPDGPDCELAVRSVKQDWNVRAMSAMSAARKEKGMCRGEKGN